LINKKRNINFRLKKLQHSAQKWNSQLKLKIFFFYSPLIRRRAALLAFFSFEQNKARWKKIKISKFFSVHLCLKQNKTFSNMKEIEVICLCQPLSSSFSKFLRLLASCQAWESPRSFIHRGDIVLRLQALSWTIILHHPVSFYFFPVGIHGIHRWRIR